MRYLIIALLLLVGISSCNPAAAQSFASEPGQDMDAFVMSIRKPVSALAREAGVELCGAIRRDGDTFRVDLVRGERYSCEFTVGADYSGHSLHTHPWEAAPGFSDGDFLAGPGYMIWRGFVKHQAGQRAVRRVL